MKKKKKGKTINYIIKKTTYFIQQKPCRTNKTEPNKIFEG